MKEKVSEIQVLITVVYGSSEWNDALFAGLDTMELLSRLQEEHEFKLKELQEGFEQQLADRDEACTKELSALKAKYEAEVHSKSTAESPRSSRDEHNYEDSDGGGTGTGTPSMELSVTVTPPGEVSELDNSQLAEEMCKEVQVEELQHELEVYKLQMERYEKEADEKYQSKVELLRKELKEEYASAVKEEKTQHALQVQHLQKELNELRHQLTEEDEPHVEALPTIDERDAEVDDTQDEELDEIQDLMVDEAQDVEVGEVRDVEVVEAQELHAGKGVPNLEEDIQRLRQLVEEREADLVQVKQEMAKRHDRYIGELMDDLGTEHAQELERQRLEIIQEEEDRQRHLVEDVRNDLLAKHIEDLENLKNELTGKHEVEKMHLKANFEEQMAAKNEQLEDRIEEELAKLKHELDALMMQEIEAAKDDQRQDLEAVFAAKWEQWKLQFSEKVNEEKVWMQQEFETRTAELESDVTEMRERMETMQLTHKKQLEYVKEELEKKSEGGKDSQAMHSGEFEYQEKIDEYKVKLDLCESEIKELEEKLQVTEQDYSNKLKEQRVEIQKREEEISELKANLEQYVSNESTDSVISNLRKRLEVLERKLEESENCLTENKKEHDKEYEELAVEHKNKYAELVKEHENECVELKMEHENKLQEHQSRVAELMTKVTEAEHKLQEQQEDYKCRLQELQSKIENEKEGEESSKKDENEVENLRQQLADVTVEFKALRQGM